MNCIKVTMIAHLRCLRGKRLSEHESMKGFLYERKWHTKPFMQKQSKEKRNILQGKKYIGGGVK